MFYGIGFKVFDAFGTCPLSVVFIFAYMDQSADDRKKFPVCIVDGINADVEMIVPFCSFIGVGRLR